MGQFIGILSSLITIISFFIFDANLSPLMKFFLQSVTIIALIYVLFMEVYSYNKSRPKKYTRAENIEYLKSKIEMEGRVVVFAGDLSWVDNDAIRKAIEQKGENLHLCVKQSAPNLDRYRNAGVNVYTYGDSNFSPITRFTLIRQGSTNEKIAITSIDDTDKKGQRLVYEIARDSQNFKDKWIVYAADDMFQLMQIINKLDAGR